MATSNQPIDDKEAASRLEILGERAALNYADAQRNSFAAHTSNGDFTEESLRSIYFEDDARAYLAFIGDALERQRPRFEGDPELFWVDGAKRLLRRYAPNPLTATFFSDKNKEQQRQMYREMARRVVVSDERIPYTHSVALGRTVLGERPQKVA